MSDEQKFADLAARCAEHDATEVFARKINRHLTRMATLRRAIDPDDASTTSPASVESLQAELDRRALEVQLVAQKATKKLTQIENGG